MTASGALRFYILGSFRIEGKKQAVHLPTHKTASLLAFLVLNPDEQSREKLAALFWGDSPGAQARASLRTALNLLRRQLGDQFLLITRESVQVNPDFPLWVDAREFQTRAAEILSEPPDSLSEFDPNLYAGDLLADFYDDWVLLERERYQAVFLATLLRLTEYYRAGSKYKRAIETARRVLVIDPSNESAHQHLMFCYLMTGNRSAALQQYEKCQRVLREELGVEPMPETMALYERIKQTVPEHQGQAALISNLPNPLTSFIGREREKQQIKELVADHSLLTLTGAGGVGKTRLALAVAADLLDAFPDGVWWVDLAPLVDPTLLPQEVALAMGLRELPRRPLLAILVSRITNKRMMLILDNCEHMVLAVGRFAETLLQSSPGLRILVTSRESLRIAGEVAWRVPPLSIPADTPLGPVGKTGEDQTKTLYQYESIRLFVERGTLALPTFALTRPNSHAIVQICRRLDGIPLAIELAAARVKLLSVQQIADRLDDSFRLLAGGSRTALPHHQTLRSTMDWSYRLLSEKEQLLLRRLSVFAGGFSLEATEEVCADQALQQSEILDLVSSLQDKSLVEVEQQEHQVRNDLLETVRHYSADKSAEIKEETEPLHARHLEFFMRMAENAEPKLQTGEQPIWLHRLEIESDNLRGALEWSLKHSRAQAEDIVEKGVRLAGALWQFWLVRGHLKEGRQWLALALEKSNGNRLAKSYARAKALVMAVGLADFHGDLSAKIAWCEEALAIARDLGERQLMAAALMFLGDYQARYVHTWPRTLARLTEALSLARQLGAKWLTALTLEHLGMGARSQGDAGRTRSYLEESLALSREVGDPWLISGILDNLGSQEAVEGNYDRAALLYDEGLRLRRELKDPPGVAGILNDMGQMARYRQDYVHAAQMFEESLALFKDYGQKESSAIVLHNLGCVTQRLGDPERATALFGESLAIFRELENVEGVISCLGGLAIVAAAKGRVLDAVKLCGAVEALLESTGAAIPPVDRAEYQQVVADAKTTLPDATFAAAWAQGEALSLDQAIAYTREQGPGQ